MAGSFGIVSQRTEQELVNEYASIAKAVAGIGSNTSIMFGGFRTAGAPFGNSRPRRLGDSRIDAGSGPPLTVGRG
jgi:hypothetical protein